MQHTSFPNTLAAATALDVHDDTARHLALGKAAYEEVGPPGNNGENNGSKKKFEDIERELKRRGIKKVNAEYVRQHRLIYANFKDTPVKLLTAVEWSVLVIAGNPNILEQARRWAKRASWESLKVTDVHAFRKTRKQDREDEKRRRHSALRDRDPAQELAVKRCSEILAQTGKRIDTAFDWIRPYTDRLTNSVRGDLLDALVNTRGKIDRVIASLEPAPYQRDAAE